MGTSRSGQGTQGIAVPFNAVALDSRPLERAIPGFELARAERHAPVCASGNGGWQSAEMVRRYAHLSADHLAPYAERLCALSGPDAGPGVDNVLAEFQGTFWAQPANPRDYRTNKPLICW